MPLFSAGSVRLESGVLGSTSMQTVPRVTNVRLGYTIPRTNVMVLGRGKPLENRPVINYAVPEATVDFYESDNQIRQMLGLVNSTGVCALIGDTKAGSSICGVRNMHVLFAPTSSANYNSQIDLKSGVLTSYALQGSVGEPVRGNFALQFLDMSGAPNPSARESTNLSTNLVKPENVSLTGLLITGYGITGANIQSFSFNIGFGRQTVTQLGTKFPIERPAVEVGASLEIQGWFDGLNSSFTGLSQYDCGAPTSGTVGLTLTPSCGAGAPTTITIKNPYLESLNIEAQAGGFSTFSASFSMPIGPNHLENTDGSVVIFG